MWLPCALTAIALWACTGLPGLLVGRHSLLGQWIATCLAIGGSSAGIAAAVATLTSGVVGSLEFHGALPSTHFHLRLDALSGFLLAPVFFIPLMGSIYGLGYWGQAEHPRTGQKLRFCYGLFVAAMALVALSADGVLFLVSWEVMALCAFFLVSTEDQKSEVRAAGWLYLVATHAGTLVLFALFGLLRLAVGSFEFLPLHLTQAGPAFRTAIFFTALVGFGFKAGLMPFHFWLPTAHANAPSHVSAVMSGVLIKMGVYGILRTLTLLPTAPASWGGLMLLLGTISALLGVLFALGQHDLKKLLAYHSIENIGIIFMGLGLAVVGQARGRSDWMVLGLAGCLLHVWNHGLFKSLLFLGAGSVIHGVGTREIDRMGGMAKAMPATATLFLVGAVAICGLPPLNGFVSELLIYLGLFRTLSATSAMALAAPALAMVGALAVACFVKAFGAVFLGTARTRRAASVREAPATMILAMAPLALCCVIIGVFPALVGASLENVIVAWSGHPMASGTLGRLAPLSLLTPLTGLLAVLASLAYWSAWRSSQFRRFSVTWDCGYALPTPRMQYTASSFAQGLVALFRVVLRPRARKEKIAGPFPTEAGFRSHVDDLVLDRLLAPLWRRFRHELSRLRFLQQGSVQGYLLYILLILLILLFSCVSLIEWVRSLFVG
jgi:hydrogenase-4 component B